MIKRRNNRGTRALTSNWKDKTLLKSKRSTPALTSAVNFNFCPKSKRSQEEMVGFAVIIVIVAVIILVFLGFALQKNDNKEIIESYEIESFIQAMMQVTIDYNYQKISIRELIKECDFYGDGCEELKSELEKVLEQSWSIQEASKIKGYFLKIYTPDKEILNITKGNESNTYKGYSQKLTEDVIIVFQVFY